MENTRAASVAMQRIMRECKEMQKKKQMFIYAQPLDVKTIGMIVVGLTILMAFHHQRSSRN